MSASFREYQCPKCNQLCPSFSALCQHAEYAHEMWYLGKNSQTVSKNLSMLPIYSKGRVLSRSDALKPLFLNSQVPSSVKLDINEQTLPKFLIEEELIKLNKNYVKLQEEMSSIYRELENRNNSTEKNIPVLNCNDISSHHQEVNGDQIAVIPPNQSFVPYFQRESNVTCLKDDYSSVEQFKDLYSSNRHINDEVQKDIPSLKFLNCPQHRFLSCPLCNERHNEQMKKVVTPSPFLNTNLHKKNHSSRLLSRTRIFSKGTKRNIQLRAEKKNISLENTVCKQESISQVSHTDSGRGESLISKTTNQNKDTFKAVYKSPPLSLKPKNSSYRYPSEIHSKLYRASNHSDNESDNFLGTFSNIKNCELSLQLVFYYLNTDDLLTCRSVCKSWRHLAQKPCYYVNMLISNRVITSMLLHSIAESCCKTQSITLQALRSRNKRTDEAVEEYLKIMRGKLEPGLEAVLRAAQNTLISLNIVSCGNLFTERSLWLAGCYCRHLTQVSYFSQLHPATPESIWSLGSGCRKLQTFIVPPLYPSHRAESFSTRCLFMIAKSWPNLKILCVGGTEVGVDGLIAVAQNCHRLKILELDHMGEVQEAAISAICKAGLKGLQKFYFTHTPVTVGALLHLYSTCRHITVIGIILAPSDYFVHPEYTPNVEEFKNKIEELKKLAQRPGLVEVLSITVQ